MSFGFGKKKGNQFFFGRTFRRDFNFLMKENIFGSQDFHKIENNLIVKGTGMRTGGQDTVTVDEQNGRVACCYDIYRQGRDIGTGKRFAKNLGRTDVRNDTSVSVIVNLNDLCLSRKNDPDIGGSSTFFENRLIFLIM